MRGLTPSHMIVDEFYYDEKTGEPNDEAIMKTRIHYNQQTKEWFIPKGTAGRAWQDGPLKNRKSFPVTTTHDIITINGPRSDINGYIDNYETMYSTKEYLTILKRTKGEKMWFLQVKKDRM